MTTDSIQQHLANYGHALRYERLPQEVIHTAKVRTIDTLGALMGGFPQESSRIARDIAAKTIAAKTPVANGATIIGTQIKTAPDMAAFANGSAARYPELTDSYHKPGSYGGHPSDVLMPVWAVAEYTRASGRDFIAALVLAYEVYLQLSDVSHDRAFDHSNFACLGTAVGAGKLLGLSETELAHCISMAAVSTNVLTQVRTGYVSMFKAVATGHAGRAGVFAALLAKAGMEGPHLPFEGKAGWCDHVAGERFTLGPMGGNEAPFKILETLIKNRPSGGLTISSVLAAERIAPLADISEVEKVIVDIHKEAMNRIGLGEYRWHPDSKETADRSLPYVVGVTLMDGTVTLRSYDEAHLRNPRLRALMQKVEVVENEEFTRAYEGEPQQHRSRVVVVTRDGKRLVGESGGDSDDMSARKDDTQMEKKFRGLCEDALGKQRVDEILDRLWNLDALNGLEELSAAFVVD